MSIIVAMRLLRYVLVPWAGLLAYAFLSFFLGHNGLHAGRHLEAERGRLSENLGALEAANRGFWRAKESLLADDDALSVYARQLGFGREGEEFVRIVGLGVAASVSVPSGQALHAEAPDYVPSRTIRAAAGAFAAAAFLFLLIRDLSGPGESAGRPPRRPPRRRPRGFPGAVDF